MLEKCDSRDDLRRDRGEKGEAKKSFSSQRPGNDRQNRHVNSNDNRKSNSVERGGHGGGGGQQGKERSGNSGRANGGSNGQTGGHRGGGSGANSRNKPGAKNVNAVYVVDGVLPENPAAIQNAISGLHK